MRRWHIPVVALLTALALVALCGCDDLRGRFHPRGETAVATGTEALVEEAPAGAEGEATTEEPAEAEPTGEKGAESGAEPAKTEAGSKEPAGTAPRKPADAEAPTKGATALPAPERKAPAIEEVLIKECTPDIAIALTHIRAADEAAAQQDVDQARRGIDKAQLALGFAGCEISSVLVRQNCERAIERIMKGDTEAAVEAIQTAVDLAQDVALEGSLRDFRNAANRAKEHVAAGKGAEAVEQVNRMVKSVQMSPTEEALEAVQEHLLGAELALDRDVPSVAEAELKGARGRLIALLETLGKAE